MKRLTKEGWRALGVYNSHDLCRRGGKGIYVRYCARSGARDVFPSRWKVIKPDGQTDPGGPWYDYGQKSFGGTGRERKAEALKRAIEWASFVYKIEGEWERDPWGDYHPPGTLEAAQAKAKAA